MRLDDAAPLTIFRKAADESCPQYNNLRLANAAANAAMGNSSMLWCRNVDRLVKSFGSSSGIKRHATSSSFSASVILLQTAIPLVIARMTNGCPGAATVPSAASTLKTSPCLGFTSAYANAASSLFQSSDSAWIFLIRS